MTARTVTLGIDLGSTAIKAVLLADGERVIGQDLAATAHNARQSADGLVRSVLEAAGVTASDIARRIATGYGRLYYDDADREVSEITCHARGARFLERDARTVIDIGGQDSKVISIAPTGKVLDFAMNDKCAAGTGRFLEVMSRALDVPIAEFGPLARQSTQALQISTTCTVFAESEVVGLVAQGSELPDIVAAIHRSIASRVGAMVQRIGVNPPLVATGGVARNAAAIEALGRELDQPITVPADSQFAGAVGAALIAHDDVARQRA